MCHFMSIMDFHIQRIIFYDYAASIFLFSMFLATIKADVTKMWC